jgi:hypothetical protein
VPLSYCAALGSDDEVVIGVVSRLRYLALSDRFFLVSLRLMRKFFLFLTFGAGDQIHVFRYDSRLIRRPCLATCPGARGPLLSLATVVLTDREEKGD